MRETPRVITGTRVGRGDQARGADDPKTQGAQTVHPGLYSRISALMRGKNLLPTPKAAKTPYDVLFGSRYSRHRIQVTSPEDERDPRTGRKIQGRPICVVFKDNVFSIPKKYSLKEAEDILQWLRSHPSYGVGKEFWETKDVQNDAKIRDTVHMVEQLAQDEGMRETVLEFLSRGDFLEDETVAGETPSFGARVLKDGEEAEDEEDEEDEDNDSDLDDDSRDEEIPASARKKAKTSVPAKTKKGRKKSR